MKQFKSIILLLIAALAFATTHAQDAKTDTIKVWGNCNMCKRTIEKAARTDSTGIIKAEWNRETKIFTLVYNSSLTSNEKIQKAIAAAGYDTEKFYGDDEAYKKLPGCCHYERRKKSDNSQSGHQH